MKAVQHVLFSFLLTGLPAAFLCDKNDEITVAVGSNLKLSCAGSGNLTWLRSGVVNGRDYQTSKVIHQGPILILQDFRFEDSGRYICTDIEGNIINETRILVGDYPGQPTNLSCVTHYSLAFTKCCWKDRKITGIATNFSLLYTIRAKSLSHLIHGSEQRDKESSGICTIYNPTGILKQSFHCCQLPIGNFTNRKETLVECSMQLRSSNALGVVTSKNITEYPLNWIKPCPPSAAYLSVQRQGQHFLLTARWLAPNMTIKSFEYKLRYRVSPKGDGGWHSFERIFKEERSFELLNSYSLVEIQVAAQPTGLHGGLTSEWSASGYNSTEVLPPTSRLRFISIVSDISKDGLEITSNWIEYDRTDETGFRYEITHSLCNGNVVSSANFSDGRTSYHASINYTDCALVSGTYCNAMGCSEENSVKIRPLLAPEFSSVVDLKISEKEFVANWKSRTSDKKVDVCGVKILAVHRSRYNGSDYAVRKLIVEERQTCDYGSLRHLGRPSICTEYMAEVNAMRVFDGVTYMRTYRSSVKKFTADGVLPWKTLNASEAGDHKIHISWSELYASNCSTLRPAIFYKAVNGSECYSGAGSCGVEYSSEGMNCEDHNSTITKNVFGDTYYQIRVSDCCLTERSYYQGEPICYHTSKEKTVKTGISTPSQPMNFRLTVQGKFLLSWDAPLHANGPITGYIISLLTTGEMRNVTTISRQIDLQAVCEEGVEKLHIRAFIRMITGEVLYGHQNTLHTEACYDLASPGNSIALIVGCITSMSLVVAAAVLAYCNKRHFKNILTGTLLPKVPMPSLNIAFNSPEIYEGSVMADVELRGTRYGQSNSAEYSKEKEKYEEIKAPLLSSVESQWADGVPSREKHSLRSDELKTKSLPISDEDQRPVSEYSFNSPRGVSCTSFQHQQQFIAENDHSVFRVSTSPRAKDSTLSEWSIIRPKESKKVNLEEYATLQEGIDNSMMGRNSSIYCSLSSIPAYLSYSTTHPASCSDSDSRSTYSRMSDIY